MQITTAGLEALRTGFRREYMNGFDQAASQYKSIATTVPSTTKESRYGWLGKMPNMREWLGARVIHGIAEHDYAIKNKDYELTIGVDRNDIKDDNLGVYAPLFQEMGRSVGAHPDMLCFEALRNGFDTPCYDGQNFFDTDHPVLDEDGETVTVSNTGGGSGTPWFLLSTQRAIKPIIFQEREKAQFVAKDDPQSENVFRNKEFVYGSDGRWNVGYGFWQMAYGSKQTLNAANYKAGRTAIQGQKGDYGRPLGLKANLLVVPNALEEQALELLNAERNAAGATNVWRGTAELLVADWL